MAVYAFSNQRRQSMPEYTEYQLFPNVKRTVWDINNADIMYPKRYAGPAFMYIHVIKWFYLENRLFSKTY